MDLLTCMFISLYADLQKLKYVGVGPPPPFPLRRSRLSVQGYTTSNSLMNGLLFVTAFTYMYFFRLWICICVLFQLRNLQSWEGQKRYHFNIRFKKKTTTLHPFVYKVRQFYCTKIYI